MSQPWDLEVPQTRRTLDMTVDRLIEHIQWWVKTHRQKQYATVELDGLSMLFFDHVTTWWEDFWENWFKSVHNRCQSTN
jgi:hypothetical protein